MNRKIAGILFLAAFCLAAVLPAAPALSAQSESPGMLTEILKKTEAFYQRTNALSADFRQITSSAAGGALSKTEATGRLFYQKPRQMRWEYLSPEAQVFVANQQLAWLYVPSERQMSMFDSKTLFASPLAQTFFDGIVEVKKHFDVTLDSKQSTKATAVLKLKPREQDPNIKELLLWIDMTNYHISSIESHDALGNTNRIYMDSQNGLPSLDAKLFQLDIPPSTIVVDTDGRELTPSDIDKLKLKMGHPQDGQK
ncbi:MAG: outer membrane lipoprotein carrier protein LolA [Syntrophobacteraceae bacterium]|nr:outer membrane lipoprotein carrier protein LolA [Desulfobacteraceae bacterium]